MHKHVHACITQLRRVTETQNGKSQINDIHTYSHKNFSEKS